MDTRGANRTFMVFDPDTKWSHTDEADTVTISLPGFKREQIRVRVDNHGHLRTCGERPVDGSKWSRFQKDLQLPDNCNIDGICPEFEKDTLTITLPKKSTSPQAAPVPEPTKPVAAEEGDKAVADEMEMARRPRPISASHGLLVNLTVAVVVLVGITVYVWHTLRNATGGASDHGHGHGELGAGSYGDEM